MALPVQVIDMPFVGGLDEGTDPRIVQEGYQTLYNADFQTRGLLGKRPGLKWRTDSSEADCTARSRLAFIDRSAILPYTVDAGNSTGTLPVFGFYSDTGRDIDTNLTTGQNASEWLVERKGIHHDISMDLNFPVMVRCGDYFIAAWQWQVIASGCEVHYKIWDAATGHTVLRGTVTVAASTSTRLQMAATSESDRALLLIRTDTNTLSGVVFNCTGTLPTVGAATSLDTSMHASATFGIADHPTLGWWVAFPRTAGNGIRTLRVTYSGSAPSISSTTDYASTDSQAANVASFDGNAFFVWDDIFTGSNHIRYAVRSHANAVVLAATGMAGGLAATALDSVGVCKSTSTKCLVVYSQTTSGYPSLLIATGTTGGVVDASVAARPHLVFMSNPFYVRDSRAAIWCATRREGNYPVAVLVDLLYTGPGNNVGPALATAEFGRARISGANRCCNVAYDTDRDTYHVAVEALDLAGAENEIDKSGVEELILERDSEKLFQMARIGPRGYFSGAIVREWDDFYLPQLGQIQVPFGSATQGSGTGLSAGTYSYVVVLEWFDHAGQLHQSAPSDPFSATIGANKDIDLTILHHTLTQWTIESSPQLSGYTHFKIYRTEESGTIFYLIDQVNTPATFANAPASAVFTYTDDTTDADLVTHRQLYTTGGVLENDHLYGGATGLKVHKGRVFAPSSEDRFRVYFSSQVQNGQPPLFNLALYFDLPGETIVGCESMDDALIVFCEKAIYAVFGEGPNRLGDPSSGQFTTMLLSTSDGCSSQRSILLHDDGIFFRSHQGMCLLTRARQVQYIGDAVSKTVEQWAHVKGAAYHPKRGEIWFVLAEGLSNIDRASTTTPIVVYDTRFKRWSTWFPSGTPNYIESLAYNPDTETMWLATVTGQLIEEDTTYTRDQSGASTYAVYPLRLVTGELSFGQRQTQKRFQRWRLQLDRINRAGGVQVRAGRDVRSVSSSYSQTWNFTTDEIGALQQDGVRGHVAIQKGHRWRFDITENPTNSTTRGLGFAGISFEVAMDRGLQRQRAAEST